MTAAPTIDPAAAPVTPRSSPSARKSERIRRGGVPMAAIVPISLTRSYTAMIMTLRMLIRTTVMRRIRMKKLRASIILAMLENGLSFCHVLAMRAGWPSFVLRSERFASRRSRTASMRSNRPTRTAYSLASLPVIRRSSRASSIWMYPSRPPGPVALSRMPATTNVFPLTEPSRFVATSTTVSPTLAPIPLAISTGTSTAPRSRTPGSFLPETIRESSSGQVRNSFSGSTPFTRMFVVSSKLLNAAPNLRRGEKASIPSVSRIASSSFFVWFGCMLRWSGRFSMAARYPRRCTCRCPRNESVMLPIIIFLNEPLTAEKTR